MLKQVLLPLVFRREKSGLVILVASGVLEHKKPLL